MENPNEVTSYDAEIHSNPSGQVWAKYFMECKEKNNLTIDDIDEALMTGWFCNAMMAMHDHLHQSKDASLERDGK